MKMTLDGEDDGEDVLIKPYAAIETADASRDFAVKV